MLEPPRQQRPIRTTRAIEVARPAKGVVGDDLDGVLVERARLAARGQLGREVHVDAGGGMRAAHPARVHVEQDAVAIGRGPDQRRTRGGRGVPERGEAQRGQQRGRQPPAGAPAAQRRTVSL